MLRQRKRLNCRIITQKEVRKKMFDKVKFKNTECFIFGRRASGSFDIRLLDGTKISAGISYKKLRLISCRKNILIERKVAVSSYG